MYPDGYPGEPLLLELTSNTLDKPLLAKLTQLAVSRVSAVHAWALRFAPRHGVEACCMCGCSCWLGARYCRTIINWLLCRDRRWNAGFARACCAGVQAKACVGEGQLVAVMTELQDVVSSNRLLYAWPEVKRIKAELKKKVRCDLG